MGIPGMAKQGEIPVLSGSFGRYDEISEIWLTQFISGFCTDPDRRCKSSGFVTLPAGAIVTTNDNLAEPGLHEVRCYDKTLLAFTWDIGERTEELSSAMA
jgi:hypothetical protein